MASPSTRVRVAPGLPRPRPGQVTWWIAGAVVSVSAVVAAVIAR